MPGLGWMLKRSLYKQELEPQWPDVYMVNHSSIDSVICQSLSSSSQFSIKWSKKERLKWLPGKTRLWKDLLYVEWDVKLYSLTYWWRHSVVVSASASINVVNRHWARLVLGWVTVWQCLRAGKPYPCVTSHLVQLSLSSLRARSIEYWPVWLGLRWGVFTCVGWQVTLCDPIWQVTLRSCVINSTFT